MGLSRSVDDLDDVPGDRAGPHRAAAGSGDAVRSPPSTPSGSNGGHGACGLLDPAGLPRSCGRLAAGIAVSTWVRPPPGRRRGCRHARGCRRPWCHATCAGSRSPRWPSRSSGLWWGSAAERRAGTERPRRAARPDWLRVSSSRGLSAGRRSRPHAGGGGAVRRDQHPGAGAARAAAQRAPPRAPCSSCVRGRSRRVGPRPASTSAAGSRVAACT